jgi:hypothetical protein
MSKYRFATAVLGVSVVYRRHAPTERNGISEGNPGPEFHILPYTWAQDKPTNAI